MSAPMPALIGHRGLPTEAPENTRASVQQAAKHGIKWVEIDVTLARDNSMVIMHDPSLKLFERPDDQLKNLTEAELRKVDAGSWYSEAFAGEPLLFLSELLTEVKALGLGLNLEIKANPDLNIATLVEGVVVALNEAQLEKDKLLISSFDHDALALVRKLLPDVQIGLLYGEFNDDWQEKVTTLNAQSVHAWVGSLTEEQAKKVSQQCPLYVYTVNDPETFQKLLSWGVSGVFCDRAQAEDMKACVR